MLTSEAAILSALDSLPVAEKKVLVPMQQEKTALPRRFVSIGECMVELSPAADPETFRVGYAGDTFNTAWYVKRLAPDWQSSFVTRVGMDSASDKMLAMIEQSGVETHNIAKSKERSVGLYMISLQNGERSFSYWRDNSAARQLADDPDKLWAAVVDGDILYFSGITMAILDVSGRDTLLQVLEDARRSGKTVVFDSNLRPRLWSSAQDMKQTVMRASAISDIVLPSYDDERDHFGDVSMDATLQRYLDAGPSTVIVKNGGGNILYSHVGETGTVSPRPAESIVDTTSAGDSFNAGFLVGLYKSETVSDAIRLGIRVAAQVIGQKGALVPVELGI